MKAKRRTAEERNQISELKDLIVSRAAAHKITAYELAQNVGMTEVGIRKILNNVTKNPSLETLQEMDVYIKNFYESDSVSEEKTKYNVQNPELSMILKKLNSIESKIESNSATISLKVDIMFEILKNAKAEELKYIENQLKLKLTNSEKGL